MNTSTIVITPRDPVILAELAEIMDDELDITSFVDHEDQLTDVERDELRRLMVSGRQIKSIESWRAGDPDSIVILNRDDHETLLDTIKATQIERLEVQVMRDAEERQIAEADAWDSMV